MAQNRFPDRKLDELWADEDYWIDLVEAINHNFVLEVDASRIEDD